MAADISDLIDPDKRLIELMRATSGGYSIKTHKLVNWISDWRKFHSS